MNHVQHVLASCTICTACAGLGTYLIRPMHCTQTVYRSSPRIMGRPDNRAPWAGSRPSALYLTPLCYTYQLLSQIWFHLMIGSVCVCACHTLRERLQKKLFWKLLASLHWWKWLVILDFEYPNWDSFKLCARGQGEGKVISNPHSPPPPNLCEWIALKHLSLDTQKWKHAKSPIISENRGLWGHWKPKAISAVKYGHST